MAGGILTNVVKGSMLGNADVRLSPRDGSDSKYRDRLNEILGWFKAGMAHHEHAAKRATAGNDQTVATEAGHVPHARDEFFGDDESKAYFPDMAGDSEDDIVRGAYIKAIELALEPENAPAKPIVSYWIITDADSTSFEAVVSATDREVHVMILTPRPENVKHERPKDPGKYNIERMWVVAGAKRISDIFAEYPEVDEEYDVGPYPVEGTTTGVQTLRVLSY